MTIPNDSQKIHNLVHFGENGYECLDEKLQVCPKENFFKRLIAKLFGYSKTHDELVVNETLKFLNLKVTEIDPAQACAIIKRIQPLMHESLTHVKANALLGKFEDLKLIKEESEKLNETIQNFKEQLSLDRTPLEIRNFYQRCFDTLKRFNLEHHKKAILESVQDATMKQALEQNWTFEEFSKSEPSLYFMLLSDGSIQKGPEFLDMTTESPNVEAFAKAKFIRLSPDQLPVLVSKLTDFRDRQNRLMSLREGKIRHKEEIENELFHMQGRLDELEKKPKNAKNIEAKKVLSNQILKKKLELKKLANEIDATPQHTTVLPLVTLNIKLSTSNHTINKETFQSMDALKDLVGTPPKTSWVNEEENSILHLDDVTIPKLEHIRDLSISGTKNLKDILPNYPQIRFLDLSNYQGEVDFNYIAAQCPNLECIRHSNATIKYPFYKPVNPIPVNAALSRPFLRQLMDGTLSADVKPDSSIQIGGKTYPFHKAVLANICHYFRNENPRPIEIESFDSVIEFAYTGLLAIKDVNHALQLMDAAETLQSPSIMRRAQAYVREKLNESTWADFTPQGEHAKRMIRLFCEQHPTLSGAEEILNGPFPHATELEDVPPLSFDTEEDKKLSDYTISVAGTDFYLHKAILASRNAFFQKYFSEGGLSKHEAGGEYQDISPQTQRAIFDYIYAGKIPSEFDQDILWAAEHFEMPQLRDSAFEANIGNILPEHDIVSACNHFDDTTLQAMYQNFETYLDACNRYSKTAEYEVGIRRLIHFSEKLIDADKSRDILLSIRHLLDNDAAKQRVSQTRRAIVSIDGYLARQWQ